MSNPLKAKTAKRQKGAPPQAGNFHTVIKGEWLDTLSATVYGYDRVAEITSANSFLADRPLHSSGLVYIHPNDVLWFPPIDEIESEILEQIEADDYYEVAIMIGGQVFKGWTVNGMFRTINNIADGFSFTAPYNPDDPNSSYLDADSYFDCALYIGADLYISGVMNSWTPDSSTDKTNVTIQCRSKSGVLIDCNPTDRNLSYTKMTLPEITKRLIAPHGITASFPYGDGGIILKAKRTATEKIFSVLNRLAKIKGFIINSSPIGNLIFDQADIDSEPIMTLRQGEQPLLSVTSSLNGTNRFSDYIAIGQSRGGQNNLAIARDDFMVTKRTTIFDAQNTDSGNIMIAAEWARSRALAASFPVTAIVGDWRDDNNNLIMENKTVMLYYPKAQIFRETKFLIQKVDLQNTDSGKVAQLTLVLPQAYTREMPEELPWVR